MNERQIGQTEILIEGQAWWTTPVISTLWEAKGEGSLEPRNLKLQWTMIAPLPSGMGDKDHVSKKININSLRKWNAEVSLISSNINTLVPALSLSVFQSRAFQVKNKQTNKQQTKTKKNPALFKAYSVWDISQIQSALGTILLLLSECMCPVGLDFKSLWIFCAVEGQEHNSSACVSLESLSYFFLISFCWSLF